MVAFLTTIAAFAAIASAIPHAHRHEHAHKHEARALEVLPGAADFAPLAGRSVSYDGSCGSWSGHSCPAGSCCGPDGWCGNGTEFCGAGCQTGFGECGTSASQIAPAAYSSPAVGTAAASGSAAPSSLQISPNGLCGQDVGYTCKGSNFGDSCSKWNYCGSNSSYTGEGCQSQYGSCGESVAPASASTAPQYSPPGYSAPVTLVTKTLPAQTSAAAAAATSAPQSSASAYSAPPAYSSPSSSQVASAPAYSAPIASTSSQAAPSSSSAATETTSAGSPPAYGSSAPSSAPTSTTDGKTALTYIKEYKGDGSTSEGWPSESDWYDFEDLWVVNKHQMGTTCNNVFGVENNSDEENEAIYNSIKEVSQSTGVDNRFILAIMMQESNGCVRVHTTSYSHDNPGLFQSNQGTGSCNPKNGSPMSPCPNDEIKQMVEDGVAGTASGDGLKQLLDTCQGKGAQSYYEAARMYNSGSVASDGNLGQGVATHCYASDVANRLSGWATGDKQCSEATVGS